MNGTTDLYPALRKITSELFALRVTGRPVEFRFEKPSMIGVRGLAFRSGEGAVIYVNPSPDETQVLKTALHEIGHVATHHGEMMDISDEWQLAGKTIPEVNTVPEKLERTVESRGDEWYRRSVELEPFGDYVQRMNALIRDYRR